MLSLLLDEATTYLVRDGFGVAPSLQWHSESRRADSKSSTGDAEGVHDDIAGQLMSFCFLRNGSFSTMQWRLSLDFHLILPGLTRGCASHVKVCMIKHVPPHPSPFLRVTSLQENNTTNESRLRVLL